jgi:hypothetical protein
MRHNCMSDNKYNTLSIDQSIFLQLFLVPSCHCVTLVVYHLQCMRERSERLSCIWILQDFEKLLVGGGVFFFWFLDFLLQSRSVLGSASRLVRRDVVAQGQEA